MARPSSFDRDAAITTAMHEIWRNGYKACSVKAMSETLGITRSSYYNAFGSQQDLFKAALAAYGQQSPDRRLFQENYDGPVLDLLVETFRDICAWRAADPEQRGCLAVNCLAELHDSEPELTAVLRAAFDKTATQLRHLLDQAVAGGELPGTTDTRVLALALQNHIVGINAFSKAMQDTSDIWPMTCVTLRGFGILHDDYGDTGDHGDFDAQL